MTLKPRDLILRCYAEHKNGQWQAFCLDLCLAAQADTFDEAKRKLSGMISDYLEEALVGEDKPYADQLLSRKAPLYSRLRYFLLRLQDIPGNARTDLHRLFVLPLPLTPAHSNHPL